MLDRRRFSFGMLLGVGAAGSAFAGSPTQQASAPARGPALTGRYGAAQPSHKSLEVKLFLTNTSGDKMSLVHMRGSRPGPWIAAERPGAPEGEQLAPIIEVDRKELMSRVGPRPTFIALAAGAELEVGPYRFETPEGQLDSVRLSATVETSDYETIELPPQIVTVASGKAKV
jgi:hypothetical protein